MAGYGIATQSQAGQLDALPLRFEQRPSRTAAAAAIALTAVVVGATVAAFALAGAHSATAGALAILSTKPLAAVQVALGILVLTALFILPIARLIARASAGRVVEIFPDRIAIAEKSLLGSRTYETPISAYVGVARRMRTTLSSVHHEVVLVHRDRRRNVVLSDDSASAIPVLEAIKRLLGLPELEARDINRVNAAPEMVGPVLGQEPARA